MIRARVSDEIYVFTSPLYAQVTAGAVLTKAGAILIDTLYYPEDTLAIKHFLEERLNQKVKYIINTHYHADHTQGTCFFPDAHVISHSLCREYLDTKGREGLVQSKLHYPQEFQDVEISLPNITFSEGEFVLTLGGKTLVLFHAPGHSDDLINVFVTNDRILFASDNMMPVPCVMEDGSHHSLVRSLEHIKEMHIDSIVQGHGEVILRGEVTRLIDNDLAYLTRIQTLVERVVSAKKSPDILTRPEFSIESCGKSRIPLNGLVTQLHRQNLQLLYAELTENGAH